MELYWCCQEWKQSFTSVQAMHEQTQLSGQNALSSTAPLGQHHIGHELRDLAAQLASLNDDVTRLEALLESSSRAYEEWDRTTTALTEWLADTESRLEQLNKIKFLVSENLEADCEVFNVFHNHYFHCLLYFNWPHFPLLSGRFTVV